MTVACGRPVRRVRPAGERRRLPGVWRIRCLAAALLFGMAAAPAHADSTASSGAGDPRFTDASLTAFARAIETDLARRGATVAIVCQTGRERRGALGLPEPMRYAHCGFWVHGAMAHRLDRPGCTDDTWRTRQACVQLGYGYRVYEVINDADRPALSRLEIGTPTRFVWNTAVADVGIAIPVADLQNRLSGFIGGQAYAALHNPSYNLLDNPFDPTHDNSNTFLLRVLLAVIDGTSDPGRVQAAIEARFQPTTVRLNPLARIGLSLSGRADMDEQRGQPGGQAVTVSFGSLRDFLAQEDLLDGAYSLAADLVRRPRLAPASN